MSSIKAAQHQSPRSGHWVNRWLVVGPLVGFVVGVLAAPVGIMAGDGTMIAGGFMAWQKDSRWKVAVASGAVALVPGALLLTYFTSGSGSGSGGLGNGPKP